MNPGRRPAMTDGSGLRKGLYRTETDHMLHSPCGITAGACIKEPAAKEKYLIQVRYIVPMLLMTNAYSILYNESSDG